MTAGQQRIQPSDIAQLRCGKTEKGNKTAKIRKRVIPDAAPVELYLLFKTGFIEVDSVSRRLGMYMLNRKDGLPRCTTLFNDGEDVLTVCKGVNRTLPISMFRMHKIGSGLSGLYERVMRFAEKYADLFGDGPVVLVISGHGEAGCIVTDAEGRLSPAEVAMLALALKPQVLVLDFCESYAGRNTILTLLKNSGVRWVTFAVGDVPDLGLSPVYAGNLREMLELLYDGRIPDLLSKFAEFYQTDMGARYADYAQTYCVFADSDTVEPFGVAICDTRTVNCLSWKARLYCNTWRQRD